MRVLEWSLGNWVPHKGMWRLPRVDLSGSGRDTYFLLSFPFPFLLSALTLLFQKKNLFTLSPPLNQSFPNPNLLFSLAIYNQFGDAFDMYMACLMRWVCGKKRRILAKRRVHDSLIGVGAWVDTQPTWELQE